MENEIDVDFAEYDLYYAGDHLVLRHVTCDQVIATEWKMASMSVLVAAIWDHERREYRQ